MKRKKILFLSSWYPVKNNPTHGIFVQRHAEAVSMFHEVYVLYVYGAEEHVYEEKKIRSETFTEHYIQFDRREKNAYQKYKIQKQIYYQAFNKLLSEWGKPDVIHLNVIYPAGIFAVDLSRKYNLPLVSTEHWTGYLPEDGSYKGLIRKYFTKKVIKHSNVVTPVTKHLENNMRAHGLNGNYLVVPNVVDTDFFTPSNDSPKNHITFFHLSSLDERQKNPQAILDSFLSVFDKNAQTKMIFAGDGENFESIKNAYKHPAIEFVFRPMGEELLRLFQRSDAFILCSNYENLPVVLIEAMSCGKPVVSSDVGGIAEYVNGATGILFTPPDVTNLVSALKKFIEIKGTFDGGHIRQTAIKHFSRMAVAEKYDSVYSQIKW